MNTKRKDSEDQRLAEMLEVIFKYAAGDLTARGTLADDDSALDGVMAGINILGEELEANIAENRQAQEKILKLNQALEEKVRQLLTTQEELEQRRAHLEQEVARQTAILTEVQRIAHLGNWEWDLVNNTLKWSDEMYRIFGLVPKQIGASYEVFLNAVHPEDRQRVDDSVREALARQHTYSIDHRILQPDGTLRYVHGQAEVMQGDDGQVISMLGTFQDITEHKLAEEQLRKQQAITSLIIETIPMRVFWKDRALRYLGCNTVFARDAGKCSPDELLGKDDSQMSWKEQAELYRADDQRVMDTDTPKLSYDEPQTTPSGEQIWLRTSKVPLHNAANEVMGMLGVYEDITESKRMELKYLESEKRFRNLAELTTDWVWQVDEHGTYVYSGAKIKDLLGYDPGEVVGKTPFDFMPREEAARVAEIFQDISSKQKPFSFLENINLHKDGHKVILETSGVPLVADDGTFNGYFGTERDITQRKLAEQTTLDERNFSNTLIASQPDIFYVLDPTGQFIRWNDKLRDVLGYSDSQIAATNALDVIHEADRPVVAQKIQEAFERGAATIDARLITKMGIRDYVFNATSADTTKGKHLIGVGTDITERKRTEAEVQKLQEQLREQAVHDPLTGLYNRRYLEESIGREIIRAERYGKPMGIVMCDIDHFKRVNDSYGHLVGDEVLKAFAELLRTHSRGSDIVCRFGGEEFLLLLPDMPPDIAYQRAEQLRASLAAQQIGKPGIRVTASFGVAAFPLDGKTQDTLISAVDTAMYHAKETGRNRVVVASAH